MSLQETKNFATQQRRLIGTRNQPKDYQWKAIQTSTSEKVVLPDTEGLFAGMPKRSEYSGIRYLDDFEQNLCTQANNTDTTWRNKAQNFALKMVRKIERMQSKIYDVTSITKIAGKREALDIRIIQEKEDRIVNNVSQYLAEIRESDEYKTTIGKLRSAKESQATPQVNDHTSTPASTAGESSARDINLNLMPEEKDPNWY